MVNTNHKEYRTPDLPFAAYLHSTRKLAFLRCEMNGSSRVDFVFEDPAGAGEELSVEFESGTAQCSPVVFYDSIRHLRRVMDGTLRSRKHGYPR